MLSIVIPVKNERFLEKTINNIKKNQDYENEIILIFDEDDPDYYYIDYPQDKLKTFINIPKKGTSVSRDLGIINATYDCIVQIDSHILFTEKGFDTFFLEQHKKNKENILCCKMLEVNSLFRPVNKYPLYQGADLILRKRTDREQSVAFSMRWIKEERKNNEVPLVMGACYIFSKERYINILKRPLSVGAGWGKDEQRLSISNWICGGTSKVIDYIVYHNTNSIKFKSEYNCENRWDYDYNALSLVNLFPMSKDLKEDLIFFIKRNYNGEYDLDHFEDLNDLINSNTELLNKNKYYNSLDRTLDDYLNYFKITDELLDLNIEYQSSNYLRKPIPYKEFEVKNSYFYQQRESFDMEYSVTSLMRSGSHIITNWIYSQLNGDVNYLHAINNPRYKVDYRRVLKKANWENNFNYKPINTTNKKILLYNFQHVDVESLQKNPFLNFVNSSVKRSVLIVRSPENYIASASYFINEGLMLTDSEDQEIEVWKDYVAKCIKYIESYSCIIYFDKFISDKNYRDYLFDLLILNNKTEKCLDKCPYYGGGSSFDKDKYKDGNASQMDVLNRWKYFEDEMWMQEILKRKDILKLKQQIIDISNYEKNIC